MLQGAQLCGAAQPPGADAHGGRVHSGALHRRGGDGRIPQHFPAHAGKVHQI